MRIVQIAAMLANLGFLGFVCYQWATNFPRDEILLPLAFTAFPLLNIAALIGLLRRSKPSIVELFFAVRRANLEKQLETIKN